VSEHPQNMHYLDALTQRLYDRVEHIAAYMRGAVMSPVPLGTRMASRRQQARRLLEMQPQQAQQMIGAGNSAPGLLDELENWLGPMAPLLMQYLQPAPEPLALPPGQEQGGPY